MIATILTLSNSRFPLGHVVSTTNALETLDPSDIAEGLRRHAGGDWGDLPAEDFQGNEYAVEHGGRLFSQYGEGAKRFWIITESDRSVTTVLMPRDY